MNWTKSEKHSASEIFELARKRDYEKLITKLKSHSLDTSDDVWCMRDLLNEKAKEFDNKYYYRYSVLLDLFTTFVIEGLLDVEELNTLSVHKLNYIKSSLEIFNYRRDTK